MPTAPPSAGPHPERVYVRASCGVQSKDGMNFGKLVWIEGTRIHVQVDTELRPLETVTLRVDLSPAPGTALLEGEVARVLAGTATEPQGFLVRITRVAGDDQPRWQQFLHAKRKGGTLSDLSDVRDSGAALQSSYTSVAERERRALLERMSVSRGAPLADRQGTSTWSSPSSGQAGGNRAAMRDALRAAMSQAPRPPERSSAPLSGPAPLGSVPPGPAPTPGTSGTRSVPPTPAPAPAGATRTVPTTPRPGMAAQPAVGMPGTAPGVPAGADDPAWLSSRMGHHTYLQVTWKTEATYSYDVHTQLASGVLTLTSDGRELPTTPPITMLLRYQALVVQVPATAVRVLPLSVTYRLDFAPNHLPDLRRMAREPSTVSTVGGTPKR